MVSITTARVHHKFDFHRASARPLNEFIRDDMERRDWPRTNKRCLFDDFYWRMNTKIHDRPEPEASGVHRARSQHSQHSHRHTIEILFVVASLTFFFSSFLFAGSLAVVLYLLPILSPIFASFYLGIRRERFATLYSFQMITIYRNKMCIQTE